MNPTLDKQLCEKYPRIFVNRHKSPQETCFCWGFECSDGWYDIIDALCEALTYTYSTGITIDGKGVSVEPPQAICDQCKEKFSTLRFYYHLEFDPVFADLAYGENPNEKACEIADRYHAYFDGIVHMAEILSGRTCELTGKPGEIHVSGGTYQGWRRTLNREFAKTDPDCVARMYVPYSELPKVKET
jgi:hypothetical protein